MLLIEKNHVGASPSTHNDNKMLYTEGHGPHGRGGHRFAMEAADGTKEEGTKVMPTTIPDPLEIGGVEATRTNKGNPPRNAILKIARAMLHENHILNFSPPCNLLVT